MGVRGRRCGVSRLAVVVTVCLWSAVLTAAPLPVAAEPMITVEPERGRCAVDNPVVTLRGEGFPPGVTLRRLVLRTRDGRYTGFDSMAGGFTVAADGTFSVPLSLAGCRSGEPEGSLFRIIVRSDGPPTIETSATFTVSASAPAPLPGLPNAGGGGMSSSRSWVAQGVLATVGGVIGLKVAAKGQTRPRRRPE